MLGFPMPVVNPRPGQLLRTRIGAGRLARSRFTLAPTALKEIVFRSMRRLRACSRHARSLRLQE